MSFLIGLALGFVAGKWGGKIYAFVKSLNDKS